MDFNNRFLFLAVFIHLAAFSARAEHLESEMDQLLKRWDNISFMHLVNHVSINEPQYVFIRHEYAGDKIERIDNKDFFTLLIDLVNSRRPTNLSELIENNLWQKVFGLSLNEILAFLYFLNMHPNQEVVFLHCRGSVEMHIQPFGRRWKENPITSGKTIADAIRKIPAL